MPDNDPPEGRERPHLDDVRARQSHALFLLWLMPVHGTANDLLSISADDFGEDNPANLEGLCQEISSDKTERFELCSKPEKGLQKHNI